MKKTLFILLIISTISAHAQFAVVDASANTSLALIKTSNTKNFLKNSAILSKTVSSLNTLKEMKSTYDEWSDAVRTVNSYIETGKEIINIANTVNDLSNLYFESIDLIVAEEELNSKEKDLYIVVFTKILNKALSSYGTSQKITTNGVFEMNDSERLTFITKLNNDVNKIYSLMIYANKKLKNAIRESRQIKKSNDLLSNSIETIKG